MTLGALETNLDGGPSQEIPNRKRLLFYVRLVCRENGVPRERADRFVQAMKFAHEDALECGDLFPTVIVAADLLRNVSESHEVGI